jgi:hypothetical protein
MSVVKTKLNLKRPRTIKTEEAPVKKQATMTPAEIAFKRHHEKIFENSLQQKAKVTHREKVEGFNKKLKEMAEHYDIPRVGPG